MKTPEQYIEDQDFSLELTDKSQELTPWERLFIEKFLDSEAGKAGVAQIVRPSPEKAVLPVRDSALQTPWEGAGLVEKKTKPAAGNKLDLEQVDEIQLVSFSIGKEEYALPMDKVKEVIKYVQPTKLPSAPPFLEGMINLRNRTTPIIRLAALLCPGRDNISENRFIVVCHHQGLQMGLLVERIATMYRMPKGDIECNVESALATGPGFIAALIKNREKIISILSIEAMVRHLLPE